MGIIDMPGIGMFFLVCVRVLCVHVLVCSCARLVLRTTRLYVFMPMIRPKGLISKGHQDP